MVVYRGESEIRIERSEAQAQNTGWFIFACMAVVAVYGIFVSGMDRAVDWLIVTGFILAGFVAMRHIRRNRMVIVIQPDRIGYGHLGRQISWIDRDGVSSMSVGTWDSEVHIGRNDGRPGETIFLSDTFDKNELKDAFEDAGIPVR